jgi:hypothetical protein
MISGIELLRIFEQEQEFFLLVFTIIGSKSAAVRSPTNILRLRARCIFVGSCAVLS